jgi:hypothetical protein
LTLGWNWPSNNPPTSSNSSVSDGMHDRLWGGIEDSYSKYSEGLTLSYLISLIMIRFEASSARRKDKGTTELIRLWWGFVPLSRFPVPQVSSLSTHYVNEKVIRS